MLWVIVLIMGQLTARARHFCNCGQRLWPRAFKGIHANQSPLGPSIGSHPFAVERPDLCSKRRTPRRQRIRRASLKIALCVCDPGKRTISPASTITIAFSVKDANGTWPAALWQPRQVHKGSQINRQIVQAQTYTLRSFRGDYLALAENGVEIHAVPRIEPQAD